jgi:acyl carrier protein
MLDFAHRSAGPGAVRPGRGRRRGAAGAEMNGLAREQVLELIQAHLADELDVDTGVIVETTRFKEDLEADSLDLYTLVQELEDTYGVQMSDEQAARILTVGQAVDFVLAHNHTGTADAER